jgi:hypothetical protein
MPGQAYGTVSTAYVLNADGSEDDESDDNRSDLRRPQAKNKS